MVRLNTSRLINGKTASALPTFTLETQRELLRVAKWWPTPSHIYDAVIPECMRVRRAVQGLERVAGAPTREVEAI